jgi:hypothetical protein
MKKIHLFLSILFGATLAGDVDLNGECDGILFAALPHPSDPNLFIGCVQGRGTVFGCNFGEVFDPAAVTCVDPALLTTTEDDILTTTTDDSDFTSTTEDGETTSWFETTTSFFTTTTRVIGDVNVNFNCPASGFGFIPHATNCSVYFECIRGVRNQRNCDPIDLNYDVISQECRQPHEALCGDIIRCA